jgi:Zn-dependent protease with chaperone function/uncharacterized tellurite resistance protein B-like protein
MNFFEHQEAARRRTGLLIAYYIFAVTLIILAIYGVTAFLLLRDNVLSPDGIIQWPLLWNPVIFLSVAGALLVLIAGGTVFKIVSLSSGGESVALMLGGRPIHPSSTDLREKRLLNIVEEIAIASGTPIPKVFILQQEPGINAFAAGMTPADAVIAVTQGALEQFNREELQGVIGHEFSHILNGDMRLNIRLIGVLNGILIIALLGYWMFRFTAQATSGNARSSRDRKSGGVAFIAILGLAIMVIGYIGVFFARLIKSAVSRQREFLADASAVQFTRNPLGLSSALKKIGALTTGSRIQSTHAEEASHLFFANGVGFSFLGLLATHPPLEERIRRIDQTFSGTFNIPSPLADDTSSLMGFAPPEIPPPLPPTASSSQGVSPLNVVADIGTLQPAALDYATALLKAMPPLILEDVRQPAGAQAVVYGLAMNPDHPKLFEHQMDYLAIHSSPAVHRHTIRLAESLRTLRPELRLPAAELSIATLRHLTPAQYREFRENLFHIASSDDDISLIEYAVLRMTLRNLDSLHGVSRRPQVRFTELSPLSDECSILLSAVAWFGSDDRIRAEAAFSRGTLRLAGVSPGAILPAHRASLKDLDDALDRLAETSPELKEQIIAAAVDTATTDGVITTEEGEVLRAIADTLDCPIPPFLPGQRIPR